MLDKTGAEAFLNNERYSNNSTSKVMYSKTFLGIKPILADIDFCDFSNDKTIEKSYVIQIIKKDNQNFTQIAHVELLPLGSGILKVNKINVNYKDKSIVKELKQELVQAAELKAKDGVLYRIRINIKNIKIKIKIKISLH